MDFKTFVVPFVALQWVWVTVIKIKFTGTAPVFGVLVAHGLEWEFFAERLEEW
ncbi:MAG: hypothetical protein WA131_09045 [Desulfitobacteriaceae bacterium]